MSAVHNGRHVDVEFVDRVGNNKLVSLMGAETYREGRLAYFRLQRRLAIEDIRRFIGPYDALRIVRVKLNRWGFGENAVCLTVYGEVYRLK